MRAPFLRPAVATLLALALGAPAATANAATGAHEMFEVGTASSPLVVRPATGPLLGAPAPAGSAVARVMLAARAASRDDAPEQQGDDDASEHAKGDDGRTRARPSRRCRRLLAARPSRLSRRDRARRTVCRRKLRGRTVPAPTVPGVSAPAAPIQGPTPTAAPPAGGTDDPTPTPAPGSGTTPAPVYAAVGVTAIDGGEKYRLTRRVATADVVSFELVNTDSQSHDLFIAPADEAGEMSGPPVQIVGRTSGQVEGKPTRAAADMRLSPGRYLLLCTVPGHGAMSVAFTVYAPAA